MTSYKLAKYNIKGSLKSIIIYYLIFSGAITGIEMVSKFSGGNGYTSGLELSSIIFLFVVGLNSFKEDFYFAQANNISRVDYFKAKAIAILPIGLVMSILDVIINRAYNLFAVSPTMYDMGYNSFSLATDPKAWIQSNSIETLFGTVTFLFAFYILSFSIGLLITIIYYKCNKIMKILVSLSPLAFVAILGSVATNYPEFVEKLGVFIHTILGLDTRNSYMAVMTFICLFIISMFFVYMLVRKAVVKRV
jgi:hypothetical protein